MVDIVNDIMSTKSYGRNFDYDDHYRWERRCQRLLARQLVKVPVFKWLGYMEVQVPGGWSSDVMNYAVADKYCQSDEFKQQIAGYLPEKEKLISLVVEGGKSLCRLEPDDFVWWLSILGKEGVHRIINLFENSGTINEEDVKEDEEYGYGFGSVEKATESEDEYYSVLYIHPENLGKLLKAAKNLIGWKKVLRYGSRLQVLALKMALLKPKYTELVLDLIAASDPKIIEQTEVKELIAKLEAAKAK